MKLPNVQNALVEKSKIKDYLLSSVHQRGKSKSFFFLQHGFSPDSWQGFAEALRLHARNHDIAEKIETPYGLRYYVDGILQTADGANPRIRTVWQFDHTRDYPRLITAYPLRR